MDVFISWSGDLSKKIAEAIRDWIPCVIQAVKPYYSPDDISKGQRWSKEIAEKLEISQVGLIILTPDNISAPWIMFEAGALSKNIKTSNVCPILFNVSPTDIKGPLLQFQCSPFSKDEFLKLMITINKALGDQGLEQNILENVFLMFWGKLEEKINNILSKVNLDGNDAPKSKRTEKDILEELLRLARKNYYSHSRDNDEKSTFLYPLKKVVTFDSKVGIITFWRDRDNVYDFKIDRLDSGAAVLDWFFQINSKGWCTAQHLKQFLDCLEEITELYLDKNAQGVFCPMGQNQQLDWDQIVRNFE